IRPCASGCGNPRNGAAVSMAGLFLPRRGHRVVRLTIRLSDNPAATPSVINFLVTFGGISFTP
ncbi:hypothetical protein ACWC28_004272, partial [Escherichia coli]